MDECYFTTIHNLVNNSNMRYRRTARSCKEQQIARLHGSISLLTQLKIPNLFNLQLNAKHFLESEGAYSTRKAYSYVSAAINKDLFNKDASISLTVNDLFLSNKTK